ncbi:MAG: response regulator [Verrucomicrobia bacterium]|nr:response regulator [Verrucomicrobiota bacterium]
MPLKVIIVDDEAPARDRIRDLLEAEPDVIVAAECADGREAVAAIGRHQPDLVFLDIQMPEVDGFEVLRRIDRERMPVVVFTTAFDQHAVRAFEFHALDYLLKPFKPARFRGSLERARERLRQTPAPGAGDAARILTLLEQLKPERVFATRFVVKSATRVVIVEAAEIDWIESSANYATLHVGDQSHLHRETMRALEEQLDPARFTRISRSAIVNIARIRELRPLMKGEYVVVLRDGTRLTMTRGIREVQQALEGSR